MNKSLYKSAVKFFLNTSIFRICYVICLFLNSFMFFLPIGSVIVALLMLWSIFIIYFYYIKNRRFFNILYSRWLYAFLLSCLITSVIHIQDNFLINLYYTYQNAVCFFLFYGLHTEKNKKRVKKEMYTIFTFIVAATTVAAAASIPLIFFTNGFDVEMLTVTENGFEYIMQHFLVYENRFTGFFTNPNLLAFTSVAAIVSAHILTKKDFVKSAGKKPLKVSLLIVSMLINFLALFLSDSNSSLVLIICYAVGIIIYKFFAGCKELTIKQLLIKSGAVLLSVLIILPVTLTFRSISKTAISAIISSKVDKAEDGSIPPSRVEDEIVSFTHENSNLDSGRIRLLTQSAAIISQYPIFGIGKANVVDYGQRYVEGGLKYNDFHNGYLTIVVCSGFLGFILFMGFAVHILRHSVLSLFMEKKTLKNSAFPCVFAFVFSYAVYAVFEKTILNEQTFMVVFFWLFMGYLSRYMLKYNHITERPKIIMPKKKLSDKIEEFDKPTEDN